MLLIYNEPEVIGGLRYSCRRFPAKYSALHIDFVNNRSCTNGVYGAALDICTFVRSTTALFEQNNAQQSFAINAPRLIPGSGLLLQTTKSNLLANSLVDKTVLSTQDVSVTAAAHTLSFYGTGSVTLSGVASAATLAGTSATNRVSLVFLPTAGTLTVTVTGSVYWAQLEVGTFPSSFIPTTTAQSRGGETLQITGTNFSNIWDSNGGTIIVDCVTEQTYFNASRYPPVFMVGTNSTDFLGCVYQVMSSGTSFNYTVRENSTYRINDTASALAQANFVIDTRSPVSTFVDRGRRPIFYDNVVLPTCNQMRIGGSFVDSIALDGFIKQLIYIPASRRLSLPDLIGATR